jgi:hypothetical protein
MGSISLASLVNRFLNAVFTGDLITNTKNSTNIRKNFKIVSRLVYLNKEKLFCKQGGKILVTLSLEVSHCNWLYCASNCLIRPYCWWTCFCNWWSCFSSGETVLVANKYR